MRSSLFWKKRNVSISYLNVVHLWYMPSGTRPTRGRVLYCSASRCGSVCLSVCPVFRSSRLVASRFDGLNQYALRIFLLVMFFSYFLILPVAAMRWLEIRTYYSLIANSIRAHALLVRVRIARAVLFCFVLLLVLSVIDWQQCFPSALVVCVYGTL